MLIGIGIVAVVGLLLFYGNRPSGGGDVPAGRAPAFTLASTGGGSVSLADYQGKDVLLYFNEGVGCDACFYQMVELEKHGRELSRAGITVLPVSVNPIDQVRDALAQFGLRTPWLIDADKQVSTAYGTLGTGMHADLPGHSFVLVDGNGEIRWSQGYPSMFVSTKDLMAAMPS